MKKYTTEIKWAFIFMLVTFLWMLFEKLMGWHDENIEQHATYTNLYAIPATLVYVFALWDKRKNDLSGKMTWKQGFISGLIISVIIAIFTPLTTLITHQFITPDYFETVSDYAVVSEQMTREEAESYFSLQNYILQGAIVALLYGAVTSAIVSIFLRKK
ncbi:DUF4199 domain-containing protein [Marivirga sp. S37H4]|uniref:DUF4199 domain-containing protein n=1 Tax=Marivirga aurantiaca TaxID=2802615 RepID=A0A935C633_9BACT|nr:DUF4199 domain-containing protein [Marivirga aurantiaca]MBK6263502.1 DUF4199 domain-containing protein [Marivirga aurantiaca]